MAITTLEKVKQYLGITKNNDDELITNLISLVEKDIETIRGKNFDNVVKNEILGYGDGETKIFNTKYKNLVKKSEIVYFDGIEDINKNYEIDYDEGKIEFNTPPNEGVKITIDYLTKEKVYPDNVELIAIQMVGYLLEKRKSTSISSERLGDYSVNYIDETLINGYPKSIVGKLKRYVNFK